MTTEPDPQIHAPELDAFLDEFSALAEKRGIQHFVIAVAGRRELPARMMLRGSVGMWIGLARELQMWIERRIHHWWDEQERSKQAEREKP